ncbi:MAG: LacI family DNA-binding transcriptional regulator [Eubacterium sp.]|nr:LacI family DNA-binding transcriptional regulator [Eubacterium sp.]
MSITAKELARQLGISAAAVSIALNHKPGVSTETRARVIRAAEAAGYDFSRQASRAARKGEIYCVIYRASNAILNYSPIFTELTDGIEQECRKNQYPLRTLQLYEQTDDFAEIAGDLRGTDCAGIILLGTEISAEVCEKFLHLNLPMVLLDSCFETVDCSSILINNAQGAYLAANYLIHKYHRQPGHLKSSLSIQNFFERDVGFKRAVRENGMSVSNSVIHDLSPTIEGARSDMLELIDGHAKLAGCYFADNDLIAIGTIKALQARGIRVPEDIPVIGFDNIREGQIIEPALSTVDIPRRFMGQTAVRQLIWQIQCPVPHTVKTEISTSVVVRGSA